MIGNVYSRKKRKKCITVVVVRGCDAVYFGREIPKFCRNPFSQFLW
jgi:hypothetical protein